MIANTCKMIAAKMVPRLTKSLVRSYEFNRLSTFVTARPQKSVAAASPSTSEINARSIEDMPGPKIYPFIGSILDLIGNEDYKASRYDKLWMRMFDKYGPIFKMIFPGNPKTVLISNPDDIEKLYRVTMQTPVRDTFNSLKKVREDATNDYFEKKGGILVENYDEWWRVRSRVQTPMMKPKNLTRYISQMDQVTLEFIERIVDFQEKLGEMPSNFQVEMYKWALESVSLVALDRRLGCLDPNLSPDSSQMQLIATVNNIFEYLNTTEMGVHWWRLFPTPTFRKLKQGHELFLRMADEHISETEAELKRRESDGKEHEMSLLETLLQRDGLTRKDVVTFILDMLFAGIDTTSHTLGFTLYLLARNKSAQKKLQEELDSVMGDGQDQITEHHLAKLSYLKNCIKESLRIFPLAIGTVRILQEDTVLSGYMVPKDYQVFAVNAVPAKSESVFSRAKEFHPERWEKDQPFGQIHPFASLPFSHGTRMCIGRRIAEQEIYIFLARVMHRFNLDYKYQDIDMVSRLVSVPSEPLRFQFTERK